MSMQISISNAIGGGGGAQGGGGGSSFADTTSFAYDGVDDYLFAASTWDALDGNLIANGGFTISLWVKLDALATTQTLWRSWDSGGNVQTAISVFSTGMVQVFTGGSGSNWSRSTINIVANQWYHIVFRLDSTNTNRYTKQSLWINGISGFTSNFFGGTMPDGFGASIGLNGFNNTNATNGNINELAVWSGYALTDAEIGNIYNNGAANDLADTNIVSRAPNNWVRSEKGTWNGREWNVANYDDAANENWLSSGLAEDSRQNDVPVAFSNLQSIELDGVDDYVNVADADNLSFGNASTDSAFSISAWINMNDATRFRVLSKMLTNATAEYALFTSASDQLYFVLYDNNTSNRISRYTSSTLTSYEGQWIHLVATYNGNGTSTGLKIYLNSTRIDNTTSDVGSYTAMHNTTAPFTIGRAFQSDANGLIDEVAMFNSELSQAQINQLYTNKNASIFNPVSYWRFEGTGTTATDIGSGGNNGTLINGATRSTDVPT
jgi:hypothetical protein